MKSSRKKWLFRIPDDFKKFLITGAAATFLDYILYSILGVFISPSLSKLASMLVACIFSFAVNRKWTFADEKSLTVHKICRYLLTQALNIFVNVAVHSLVLRMTDRKFFSFAAATASAMMINFLGQKFFVFSRGKQ